MSTTSDAAVDGERVEPPSVARESLGVVRLAFYVVFWSALVVLGRPSGGAAAGLSAFETPFADLDATDQRTYRELQEGLIEAEARRSRSGRWPTIAELAAAGVPPFAPDPIDQAGYAWTRASTPTIVNYVGTPRVGSGRKVFVLVVTEPPPGTPVDPAQVVDEIHHKLGDGTLIHVGTWLGPALREPGRAIAAPDAAMGFRQIISGVGRP
ncbi:MAG TPA: hypothetical protein VGM56_28665 [Byssovorax sp.]|jgi:hypothetical protein